MRDLSQHSRKIQNYSGRVSADKWTAITMRLTQPILLSFLRAKFNCQGFRLTALCLTITGLLQPGVAGSQTMKAPDITKTPTLYVVPYAHLDTQWRLEFQQNISEELLKTIQGDLDY